MRPPRPQPKPVRRRLRPHLLGAAALVAAGCGSDRLLDRIGPPKPSVERTSSAIVGGSREYGHDSVALVYNDREYYLCTGTIIHERIFLTAAHCIADDDNPRHYTVYGGNNPFYGYEWKADVAEVHAHPDYDDQWLEHDVGIVVLSEDAPVEPYRWQKKRDDSVYEEGSEFLAVGYGVTSESGEDDSGVKRKVELTISDVGTDAFAFGSASANVCSGDSGGPALKELDGHWTVIGTVSYGDPDCSAYGVDMRTDDNADFISSHIPKAKSDDDGLFGCSVAAANRRSGRASILLLMLLALSAPRWPLRRSER